MKLVAIKLIKFYQSHLRRYHNRQCIYTPTCSNYTIEAIEKYGFILGLRYGYLRIKRCNGALFKGGEDRL
jgi:putative membrane protein insertion efficiency factor